jgi:hypothetical protein
MDVDMYELRNNRQSPGEPYTRWFSSATDKVDLGVFYDRINGSPRTGTTSKEVGFDLKFDSLVLSYRSIDFYRLYHEIERDEMCLYDDEDGIMFPSRKKIDIANLIERFRELSKDIDPSVRAFVLDKMSGYKG